MLFPQKLYIYECICTAKNAGKGYIYIYNIICVQFFNMCQVKCDNLMKNESQKTGAKWILHVKESVTGTDIPKASIHIFISYTKAVTRSAFRSHDWLKRMWCIWSIDERGKVSFYVFRFPGHCLSVSLSVSLMVYREQRIQASETAPNSCSIKVGLSRCVSVNAGI